MSDISDEFDCWVGMVFPADIPQDQRDALMSAFYAGILVGSLAERDKAVQFVKDVTLYVDQQRAIQNAEYN